MAQTNSTPIQLYNSTTAAAAPIAANLANGELAINITDGKLYYKDNSGVVQVIATKGAGTIGGSTTQIQYNNAGALAGNAAMTFNSGTSTTTLTTLNLTNALGATYGGTAQSTYTQGDVLYSSAANTLAKLSIGAVNYILASTGSVPQWVAPSSIAVLTATNLAGGLAGSVPYQSALDTTTFLAIGAANRVMTSTGSAPQWVTSLTGLTGVSTTTLTTSSTVTINGGTANGVGYLDGSKVLTTGSALTFDGSTLIGTAADGTNNFKAKATTGVMRFTGYVSAFSGSLIESVNGAESSYAPLTTVGSYFAWNNGSEQMRLTSTGLGIGTSSPAYKLDVDRGASNGIVARLGRTSGQALYVFADTTSVFMGSDTSLATSISFNETNDNIELYTNNTRRALLDSAGNLGLGVTPSAFAFRVAQQIGAAASISAAGGSNSSLAEFGANRYLNSSGNEIYIGNNYATLYQQNNGAHQWFQAASGTAGNVISFTQAMTLDASGNLGVGVTSPSARLHVASGDANVALIATSRASGAFIQYNLAASGAGLGYLGASSQFMSTGTSSDFGIRAEANLLFATGGNTERARIDSSGNLLVGKTSSGTTNIGVESRADGTFIATKSGSTSATETMVVYSTGASALRFYVSMDGTVNATSIVITAISDERLKENVRDINTGLDAIMALKPRRFDWREGKGQDKKDVAGFIAQEFETVFPECVNTSKAGADGIEYKNINHETLIPTLVKAIQEQQALITQLTARITALETA